MPVITLQTAVHAPIQRVFDLARSIDLHQHSLSGSGEQAIAGVTRGLIGFGESVTWRAKHLGFWQTLTSQITRFERPYQFRDSMVRGAFQRFDHDHLFRQEGEETLMTDIFDYTAPLGPLGLLADRLFLTAYMTNLLRERNAVVKQVAESGAWQQFLPS